MSLNMSDILSLSSMKNCELLVRGDNFLQPISGITIMESPDISKWVDKGHVILSSLYSLSGHEDTMDDFVKELKCCEIGGIIVKTRYSENLYDALIRSCKKYRLNLVKIPQSTLYTRIMQEVMGQLFSYQLSRANYFKTCHEAFMKIALGGQGIDAIISVLSGMIDFKMLIYDISGYLMASDFNDFTEGDTLIRSSGELIKAKGENLEYYQQTIKISDKTFTGAAIPFRALKRTKGYLFIIKDAEHLFNEYEWIAIESAINVLNLEMTKQLAVTQIEQRFRNDLLSDLLVGNIPSESIILQRADTIGWNLSKPHLAVVIQFTLADKNHSKDDLAHTMQGLQNLLSKGLASYSKTFANQNIIGTINDTFTILWAYDTQKPHSKNISAIKATIENLFEIGSLQYDLSSFSAGIGNEISDIYGISKSYDEAVSAMKYGRIIYGENSVCDINGLGVYRLITQFHDKEKLYEFIPPSLKKLADYDNDTNSNLLETLDVYLSCDCNSVKAAQLMYVHYKTLVYRINRIKSIMGVDNLDGDIRLEMQLALKIIKLASPGIKTDKTERK